MKKIAILTCMLSNKVCTRMSCLNAFQNKSDFFRNMLMIRIWQL